MKIYKNKRGVTRVCIDGRCFSIRWRKSSATYVIYEGRAIFESGFGDESQAIAFVTERIKQ